MIPLVHPAKIIWPGGEQEQGHWVVLQVQEEGYESSLSFRRRVAKYHKVSMRCPKLFHPKPKYLREFMRGLQVSKGGVQIQPL